MAFISNGEKLGSGQIWHEKLRMIKGKVYGRAIHHLNIHQIKMQVK